MCTMQLQKIVPDELEGALRDIVRSAYLEHPGYSWIGEDILEELEEVISDELDTCREEYPGSL